MRGFFAGSELKNDRPEVSLIPKCGACQLFRQCSTPKMKPFGKGRKGILVVGEAPGATEDERGRPFIGKAGQHLRFELNEVGIDLDRDCWTTNAIICRPPENKIPHERVVEYCRPNLEKTMQELSPKAVLLLGATAIKSAIGSVYREDTGQMSTWTGWQIPNQQPNAWICPTYHPSYLLRMQNRVLDAFFRRHLEALVGVAGSRPWRDVPRWAEQVKIILDPHLAAKMIRQVISDGKPTAFDYETNCLKPESLGARILCCAASQIGGLTFAFPWHGEAISAMREFIVSPVPKIASNLKFEDRWTRHVFGQRVLHWYWDTMLAAHTMDCRGGICSVKFMAYVLLGVGSYNEHIEEFLQETAGGKLNRAGEEIELTQLLRYCGEDALYEGLVAEKQWELLKAQDIGSLIPDLA